MEKPELLPCPFCGNAAELMLPKDGQEQSPFVQCTACGTNNGIHTTYYQETTSVEVVTKRWNTRASLGPSEPSLPPGNLNVQKLDDAVLALLAFKIHSPVFDANLGVQTELPSEALERLHRVGMLSDEPSLIPGRKVYLSEVGALRAHELFRRLFCD